MLRTPIDYDLNRLKVFNPLIIASQSPEASQLGYPDNSFTYLLVSAGQYQDTLNAYLYAEKEILPYLTEHGVHALTPELILQWLNEIHRRIANTIGYEQSLVDKATETERDLTGCYIESQVLRWEHSFNVNHIIIGYFAEHKHPDKHQLADMLVTQGIERGLAIKFSEILIAVSESDIEVPESQRRFLPKEASFAYRGVVILNQLATKWHQDKFSQAEIEVIQAVVKICLPPEQFSARMTKFASELIEKWQRCSQKRAGVIDLAAFAFQQLTSIHAYFNGNGRTALCFMNILLKSLGQPDILLRNDRDRLEQSSAYNLAIKKIDEDIKPFKTLLRNKIRFAKKQQDPVKCRLISARCQFAEAFLRYQTIHGLEATERFYQKNYADIEKKYRLAIQKSNKTDEVIFSRLLLESAYSVNQLCHSSAKSSFLSLENKDKIKRLMQQARVLQNQCRQINFEEDNDYPQLKDQLSKNFLAIITLRKECPKQLPSESLNAFYNEVMTEFKHVYNQVLDLIQKSPEVIKAPTN